MPSSISEHLGELRQAATLAALNYEVWWVYKSSDTRSRYVDAMNRYHIHFVTAIHAHFVAMISALYRIYETRDDTHNFKALLRAIAAAHGTAAAAPFEQQFDALKPIWIKVSRLRNEAFGHRSTSASIAEVFASVHVSPNEFKKLVEGTLELLNSISRQFENSIHAFNTGASEDTIRMLDDLNSVRRG